MHTLLAEIGKLLINHTLRFKILWIFTKAPEATLKAKKSKKCQHKLEY